jgi:uncharacterized protein (DUF433 family)
MAMTTERIEINPAIMMGKPVIRGTRIMVELILRKLAEGTSQGELLQDYPYLTTEDIRAAVAYGAASVESGAGRCREQERRGGICQAACGALRRS